MTETVIQVRYRDMDAGGVVHHSVYPIWYEIARMDVLTSVGFPWTRQHEYDIDPVMVNLNLDYLSLVRYPGTVTIRSRIVLAEPKKLKIAYECFQGDTCVNKAESFHIWCQHLKSHPLEDILPDVYANLRAACES